MDKHIPFQKLSPRVATDRDRLLDDSSMDYATHVMKHAGKHNINIEVIQPPERVPWWHVLGGGKWPSLVEKNQVD